MRNDCPESNSRIVWHLRDIRVAREVCHMYSGQSRLLGVELRIMQSAHLRIVIVHTLRLDSHRVGRVPRGLM